MQFNVVNYNTGDNPNPQILFTGTKGECKNYMKREKLEDWMGVEIEEVAA